MVPLKGLSDCRFLAELPPFTKLLAAQVITLQLRPTDVGLSPRVDVDRFSTDLSLQQHFNRSSRLGF